MFLGLVTIIALRSNHSAAQLIENNHQSYVNVKRVILPSSGQEPKGFKHLLERMAKTD